MHHTQFKAMLSDVDVAYAIRPVIQQRHLTFAETRDALIALDGPRAVGIARVVTLPSAGRAVSS